MSSKTRATSSQKTSEVQCCHPCPKCPKQTMCLHEPSCERTPFYCGDCYEIAAKESRRWYRREDFPKEQEPASNPELYHGIVNSNRKYAGKKLPGVLRGWIEWSINFGDWVLNYHGCNNVNVEPRLIPDKYNGNCETCNAPLLQNKHPKYDIVYLLCMECKQ